MLFGGIFHPDMGKLFYIYVIVILFGCIFHPDMGKLFYMYVIVMMFLAKLAVFYIKAHQKRFRI
jgi:hypothetical protein